MNTNRLNMERDTRHFKDATYTRKETDKEGIL
jgi:hypothetical protein